VESASLPLDASTFSIKGNSGYNVEHAKSVWKNGLRSGLELNILSALGPWGSFEASSVSLEFQLKTSTSASISEIVLSSLSTSDNGRWLFCTSDGQPHSLELHVGVLSPNQGECIFQNTLKGGCPAGVVEDCTWPLNPPIVGQCFRMDITCLSPIDSSPLRMADIVKNQNMRVQVELRTQVGWFGWSEDLISTLSHKLSDNTVAIGSDAAATMQSFQNKPLTPVCKELMRMCKVMAHFKAWLTPMWGEFRVDPSPTNDPVQIGVTTATGTTEIWNMTAAKKVYKVPDESIVEKRMLCISRAGLQEECCVAKGMNVVQSLPEGVDFHTVHQLTQARMKTF